MSKGITNERIKEMRLKNKLTQVELAKIVNVSSQVISNWERGYTDLSHSDIVNLSEALDCSTEYLLGKSDNKKRYNSDEPYLTKKDERDLAKRMEEIKKELKEGTGKDGLSFRGQPMNEEAIDSLLEALEHADRITTLANKKFTPKKYR